MAKEAICKLPEEAAHITEYENFIKRNSGEIAKAVDNAFREQGEAIKGRLLGIIAEYIADNPAHYRWRSDGCPYDDSGELVKDGNIDLNQSVYEFLSEEYTGEWEPTFESHHGKRYRTYGDSLSGRTQEIAGEIMQETTSRMLKKHFGESFDEALFDKAMLECYDSIFDNSTETVKYYCWEEPVQMAGIKEIPLREVVF